MDSSALTVANSFTTSKRCYQISKIRKGKDDYSYANPKIWHTTPKKRIFSGRIIVLVNQYTISAAESFCLALRNERNITMMGETTAGAFSDSNDGYLPNGWHFTYSIGAWTDCNESLWEEKGLPPDINLDRVSKECNNSDPYLDQAIKFINKN